MKLPTVQGAKTAFQTAMNSAWATISTRILIWVFIAVAGFALARGRDFIDTLVEHKIQQSPSIKAMNIELNGQGDQLDTLEVKFEQKRAEDRELASAQIEADPALERVLRQRAANKTAAIRRKKETDSLLDLLAR